MKKCDRTSKTAEKKKMTEYEKFKRCWELMCKLKSLWATVLCAITSAVTTLILLL